MLQKKYNCTFTYADDVISARKIQLPSDSLSFKDAIRYLRLKTNLNYHELDNKFVAVTKPTAALLICGYLIDGKTKTPIENATINTESRSTLTDEIGYFKITLSHEKEIVSLRHLGYTPAIQTLEGFAKNNCINIYLYPEIESLSTVTLNNFLTKGIDKLADGAFNINFSNFGILPGLVETDVLQTIQALPGINSVNETVSNINIRGGTNDQNLILWDGIKMYQTSHFFGLISMFNPQITTDVSIVKNGTNADFSDGISGTIAMKTDTKINNKFKGSAGANFLSADIFFDIPTSKNSSLQISGRKALNEFISTPTYENYFGRIQQDSEFEDMDDNIEFDFYDTSLRWLYQISEKDQLRINGIYATNELVYSELANAKELESSLVQWNFGAGINYKRNWNNNLTTIVNIYESDYDLESVNKNTTDNLEVLQKNKVSETSAKASAWYKYNNQLSILGGLQYVENGITNKTELDDPTYNKNIVDVIREYAFFSQANFTTIDNKTSIKVGGRYSYIEQINKHLVEPRISLSHKINKHLTVELLGELKHQNSSQIIDSENNFLGIEKRRWQSTSDRDTLPELQEIPITIGKQASFGVNFNKKGWLLSLEGYYKDIDQITSNSQGFVNQYEYLDVPIIGGYIVYGADIFINKRFKKLSTWLSYSYADNCYVFENTENQTFPDNFYNNIDVRHTISGGITYNFMNLKIAAGANWRTGKPTTLPVANNSVVFNTISGRYEPIYQTANSSRLQDYLRIDASASYSFNIHKNIRGTAGISVWNVSNQQNIISNYFKVNEDNTTVSEVKGNALELTPNVIFRVSF